LLLGMRSDLSELNAMAPQLKIRWEKLPENPKEVVGIGHEVYELRKLASRVRSRPQDITSASLRALRAAINKSLEAGSPVILGVESDSHWIVLAGFDEDRNYVWIDSADEPLSDSWAWEEVEEWIGEVEPPYEAIAIHPGRGQDSRRSMVPHIAGIYELLASDEDLAGEWGAYLDDLDSVFNFKKAQGPIMDAETFFEGNEEAIVQPVLWMDEDLEEKTVREVYANYRTVANFHSLALPACFEAHAIAHMALVLKQNVE
jgi:hypothetical protein